MAASLLHQQRTGRHRASMRGPAYLAQLNEAARALGEVLDIYGLAGSAMKLITRDELAGGMFHDGGNILRAADGTVYRSLAVRRGQAIAAITVLAGRADAKS